jgi:hypothetical protein
MFHVSGFIGASIISASQIYSSVILFLLIIRNYSLCDITFILNFVSISQLVQTLID